MCSFQNVSLQNLETSCFMYQNSLYLYKGQTKKKKDFLPQNPYRSTNHYQPCLTQSYSALQVKKHFRVTHDLTNPFQTSFHCQIEAPMEMREFLNDS